ncbi:MAG: cellulase family glycosylhydrolase [Crenarchaeota archaeon]|nr:cellulase family glycosylhydrolase [Thermoproteota archaeon]
MKKTIIKNAIISALLILTICAPLAAINSEAIFAQAATTGTVVSTELINYYSMTTSEIQSFVKTLHDQGITTLTVRINSFSEYTINSNTAIAKIKTIIPIANSQGISINVDLHTWYTTWDNKFRDSASNAVANRNTYINYVKATVSALNGCNVNAFMVLNEPQARTASISENNFILTVISAANSVTDKPISVRFMAGYSPSTGHYSPEIDKVCDFVCRNTYWDARNPTTPVYGCTEAKILNALSTAKSQNKELWITEFGKSNSNLAEQQAYVKAFVAYAKSKGINQIFCWVSQPESSGETYNIFSGYNPNPAFRELVSSTTVNPTKPSSNPTPSSTLHPTTNPTSNPRPTSNPNPVAIPKPPPTENPSTETRTPSVTSSRPWTWHQWTWSSWTGYNYWWRR